MKLVVVRGFADFVRGDEIVDPKAIAEALDAYPQYVVAVNDSENNALLANKDNV